MNSTSPQCQQAVGSPAKPRASESGSEALPFVAPLAELENVAGCGGKAFRLAEVQRLGFSVPEAVVVTDTAFQAVLRVDALGETIAEIHRSIAADQPTLLAAAAAKIESMFREAELPLEVTQAVEDAGAALLARGPLVIRSSACGEDGDGAAFAGQLDSFLNVDSVEAMFDAIRRCWASYWSHRSLAYQRARATRLQGMGVLLQRQVDARMAGVLFTQSFASRDAKWMVVEYGEGLADDLVSGEVEPTRLFIASGDWRCDRNAGHADLGDAVIAKLADAGRSLEQHFQQPQDIEWVLDHEGRVQLVQCRPITTPGRVGAPLVDSEPLPAGAVVWSNANVNENFPEPICPLLYSLASMGYYHYFRNLGISFGISRSRIAAMEYPLRNIIGTHGGRIYYNLTSIHAVLNAAPFGSFLSEAFDQFVGAEAISPSDRLLVDSPRSGRLREACESIWIAIQTLTRFRRLERRLVVFESTIDAFAADSHPSSLGEKPDLELLNLWRRIGQIRCQWTDAAMADASSMISYGLSQRLLAREFPEPADAALVNRLLTGLCNVVSGLPTERLWELSRMARSRPDFVELLVSKPADEVWQTLHSDSSFAELREAIDEFIEAWGFRCSGELMLTWPSYQENPAALIELLRAYVQRESESPEDLLSRQQRNREQETHRVLRELRRRRLSRFVPWPRKDAVARRLFQWTQQSIACRERARLKQALLYSRCRRLALVTGERLVRRGLLPDRDDIFFLTYPEIESLLAGASMFPHSTAQLASLRRRAQEQLPEAPPDRLRLAPGEYWDGKTAVPSNSPSSETPGVFCGTGVSGGQMKGRAIVLSDPSQFEQVTAGDILVTRQTDPGWGPILFLVRGLVMERGGMLSHGAILAREYGIPTVVDVRGATHKIESGQQVLVDGDRGVVEILV